MIVTTFEADGFRNLSDVVLRPHPSLNFVVGANGAGKSSLLEALQCLATGAGFRSRRYRDHLAHGADEYVLRAELLDVGRDVAHRCGVRRGRDGSLDARLDFEPVGSFVEIARVLPVKVLTPDSHLLVQGAPDERRRFLDWGCFHAGEAFLPAWRRYRRALSQRNELLRDGAPGREIGAWDESLVRDGERLHGLRSAYASELARCVKKRAQHVDFPFHVELDLRSGWAKDDSLERALLRNIETHRRMRTTTDGPHRAELVIRVDGHPARDVLSRGQQKLLVYLMHLAQLDVLDGPGVPEDGGGADDGVDATDPSPTDVGPRRRRDLRGTRPVVLCDDLGSELDGRAGGTLLDALVGTGSQVFVSGVTLPAGLPGRAVDEAGAGGARGGPGSGRDGGGKGAPALAAAPSGTTLDGTENSDPPRSFAVFTLVAGRLRT